MHHLRSTSRSWWVVLGLVLGAIAIPGLAVAATATLVNIRGNDHTAYVTPANQLRTAETDPALNVHLEGAADSGCVDLGTPSASRATVFKEMNLVDNGNTGSGPGSAGVFLSSTCTGSDIGGANFATAGGQAFPLGTGVTVPAGRHISLLTFGMFGRVDLYGYTVPTAAASSPTATVGSAQARRLAAALLRGRR